jgi:hypothetical protein
VAAVLLAGSLVVAGRAPWRATGADLASAEAHAGAIPVQTEPSVDGLTDAPLAADPAVPAATETPTAIVTPAPPPAAPPPTASSRTARRPSVPTRATPPPAPADPRAVDTPGPSFQGSVTPIDETTAARMTSSWRPGCPVPLSDLRLVKLTHWGFDGQPHPGDLVIHRDHADRILTVFASLFEARFPIERVRPIEEFGGDDDRSMAANNTSGFNCRKVAGTRRWSQHAHGWAVDINPVQNPYVLPSGEVRPPAGRAHTRRDPAVPGLITADGPVVATFSRIGWSWGGRWRSPDYQHFSATGR